MKTLRVLSAVVLMFSATFVFADPPTQVGRLNFLSGTVSFAPAEANDEWAIAMLNRPVTTGDRLWVDADGRAEMHIGSTAVRIAAFTSLDVLNLDERGTQLRLAQGSVNVRLRTLDVGGNFEISTPAGAVLLTQPGSYRVIVDPSGTAITIVVRRGQADVLTGAAPFTIGENQLATIASGSQQIYLAPAADEFDNWSALRDSREDNVAATRYVSQDMTGYEELDRHGTWSSEPEYGTVWYPTAVSANWAPYREGHWTWISPWGWTWIDDAPWGFAPSHYGRWVWVRNRWAWTPGKRDARPQYAPALVAFVGGANWSVSVSSGPAVGWVPLGWREPYIPWYRSSPTYVRSVNRTQVTDITIIDRYASARNIDNIRYMNRTVPSAMTVVPREAFVSGQRADRSSVRMSAQALAEVRVTHEAPVLRPDRASFGASRPGPRLPDAVAAREVLVATPPPAPVRADRDGTPGNNRGQGSQRDDRPRVRVVPAQPAGATPVVQRAVPEAGIAPAVTSTPKVEAIRPQVVRSRERPQQPSETRQPISDPQARQAAERQRQMQQAQQAQSATREQQRRIQQEQQAQRLMQQQSAQREQQRARQEQQQHLQQERAQREQQRSQQREAQRQSQQQRTAESRQQVVPPARPAQVQPPQPPSAQPAQQPSAQAPRQPREPSKGGDRDK